MADSVLSAEEAKARAHERQRRWREANAERVRENHRRYYEENRERISERQQRYYAANRERLLAGMTAYRQTEGWRVSREARRALGKDRAYNFQKNHGLSVEAWLALWTSQHGRCYLCDDLLSFDLTKVHVDHYHGCGAGHPVNRSCDLCRRGLACQACNQAIGFAGDNPDRLRLLATRLDAANAIIRARLAVGGGGQNG